MLYFAPVNLYGNYIYRHILLKHGADYVFSELILIKNLDKIKKDNKLDILKEDIPKTIFQIGIGSEKELDYGVKLLVRKIKGIKEININMGCPQSTMQMKKTCGGILYDTKLMGKLAFALSKYDLIGSAKIRLGTSEKNIQIEEYLEVLQKNGIKKVYIHARPLRYGYSKPAMFDKFEKVKNKFPKMTLVYNGDIDSPESCKGYTDVMIGRAALSNPFIFQDIKDRKRYNVGEYDPIVKDPHIIRYKDVKFSDEKVKVINEYLDIAKQHDLRITLVRSNLSYLCKGITGYKRFAGKIQKIKNIEEIRREFSDWVG